MNKPGAILTSILNECGKHLFRMNSAYNKILTLIPFNNEKVLHLTDDEVEHIDQFIYRFSKLQDAIGNKLFKALLNALGEETTDKSFVDIFNRLEQLNIVEN